METIKPRRKECIEGTRPISTFHERNLSKSSNLSFLPPSYSRPRFIPRIQTHRLSPSSLAFTSRHATKFILSRQGRRIDISRFSARARNPINEWREDCNRRRDAINGYRCGEGVDTYEQGWSVLHVYACVIRQVSVPRCLPTCIGAGHGVLTRSIGFTLS